MQPRKHKNTKQRTKKETFSFMISWRRAPGALLTIVLLSAACNTSTPNRDPSALTIAVIPKGTSHVFWQSIHAGANQAAQELGVTVIWRGPLREDDRDAQVSYVEGFISRGVSGIVLAPLDESALVGPVSDAKRSGIPGD